MGWQGTVLMERSRQEELWHKELKVTLVQPGAHFYSGATWVWGAYPKPLHVTDLENYWQLLHARFPYFENNEKIVPSLLRSVFIFHA